MEGETSSSSLDQDTFDVLLRLAKKGSSIEKISKFLNLEFQEVVLILSQYANISQTKLEIAFRMKEYGESLSSISDSCIIPLISLHMIFTDTIHMIDGVSQGENKQGGREVRSVATTRENPKHFSRPRLGISAANPVKIEDFDNVPCKRRREETLELPKGKYQGQVLNGRPHGKGTMKYRFKTYEGGWVNGKKQGFGILTWNDGSKYEGEFDNDKANGKGIKQWVSGEVYDGLWRDDRKHGKGVFIWVDRTKYEGEFVNNIFRSGTAVWTDGKTYSGTWRGSLMHGYGVLTWLDGEQYEGQFKHGKKHGKGCHKWADGAVYDGLWEDNLRHGAGVQTFPDRSCYDGMFANDRYNGQGVFTYPDRTIYEGSWVNDKKHGKGVTTYADGRQFLGRWSQGKEIESSMLYGGGRSL